MKVLVLGGDGYLGWPTAMHLSACGHEVAVVDNYFRRNICRDENVEPLFQVDNLNRRAGLWEKTTGKIIAVHIGDLTQWEFTKKVFCSFEPEAIVHYAEQPSAPYSMLNRQAAMRTLRNNLETTANVIFAVRKYVPTAHVVKLGTMGEYGTPNIDIEEGWLDVEHKGRRQKFLYPRQAGSLYHTTKIMDTDLLWFYVRMWDIPVTDLMQGPVYGLHTYENAADDRLLPFFNYDEMFGTVLNRFIVQAVAQYPLTVFGKGGQTRGYLNLKDTLQCVRLSVENPADKGELRIFNQFVETFSVNELAQQVKRVGDDMGLKVQIKSIANPRKEAEDHYYQPVHTGLLELGLEPHPLTDNDLYEMIRTVMRYREKINVDVIFRGIKWA